MKKIGIILLWLLVWQLLSMVIHNSILLAGPVESVGALWQMILTREYWHAILFSLIRIIGGFFFGSVLGMILAWGSYRASLLEDFLKPFISVLKAVPVASFVIILLIWAGNKMLSFYISSLVVLPLLYINTLNGLRATDKKILEMAEVFRIPMFRRVRYIYIPSVYPYLYSAFQTSLGMAWKSGVAAEVIGQPIGSMGNGLYQSKIYLETAELFAWTITIVAFSFIAEKLFLKVAGICFNQKE
ncbi:ABC-type nitrate/sulfonate/bicarbonate transport system, permease component [Lachnospiraceae bacterium JC7]|nr:ABC-type nitrate/sulfonate/bicarbonate transport system, permease component [Lachnospiraceae bacterium JC7]